MQLSTSITRGGLRSRGSSFKTCAASLIVLMMFVTGCASDTSFDRHNMSRLWLSQDGKNLYFDATVSMAYPEDSVEAEEARLDWLAQWLKLRKFCEKGHTVTSRRAIGDQEYNPQRHDLRYQVKCS